jgi:hypothetical protein
MRLEPPPTFLEIGILSEIPKALSNPLTDIQSTIDNLRTGTGSKQVGFAECVF